MGIDNDARRRLEHLSAISLPPDENPYSALINACHNDPTEIQRLYSAHRTKRNAQQREKFLAADFQGLSIDQTILRLARPHLEPGFKDERNCFVLWARPPDHIVLLAAKLQHLLTKAAAGIWLMPTHRMHMTTLEVAFAKTPQEIGDLVSTIRPSIPDIASYTRLHRARLVKPMVSYDTSAFAVSFLPASGEEPLSPLPTAPDAPSDTVVQGDGYTYHHLRRDLFDKVQQAGLRVGSRYQVPSAHVTLGRFLDEADHDTPEKRARWVRAIDDINGWLREEVWDNKHGQYIGEWVVGHEKGLDTRDGTLWYGGGRTILLGEGF